MKFASFILLLPFFTYLHSAAQQKENPSTSVFIDSVSVKKFVENVRGYDKTHKAPNYAMLFGVSKKGWITKADVAYLITLVNSDEKCKCVQNAFSSYMIPSTEYSTIGGVAMDIIDAYRTGETYPDKMWKCTKYDKQRAQEIKEWWETQK